MSSIFLSLRLIITKSGLNLVMRISGGTVPPFSHRPGKSAKIWRFSGFEANRVLAIWLNTELWRHVNRPSSKATGHQLRICSRLLLYLQRPHLSVFLMPHLFKLSGVLRPLLQAFIAKDSTPLGMLSFMLFHVTSCSSSIRSFKKSPWTVNLLTLLFQFINVS